MTLLWYVRTKPGFSPSLGDAVLRVVGASHRAAMSTVDVSLLQYTPANQCQQQQLVLYWHAGPARYHLHEWRIHIGTVGHLTRQQITYSPSTLHGYTCNFHLHCTFYQSRCRRLDGVEIRPSKLLASRVCASSSVSVIIKAHLHIRSAARCVKHRCNVLWMKFSDRCSVAPSGMVQPRVANWRAAKFGSRSDFCCMTHGHCVVPANQIEENEYLVTSV